MHRSLLLWLTLSSLASLLACDEASEPETEERPESRRPPIDHGPGPDAATQPLEARLHALGQELLSRYEPDEFFHSGELQQGQIMDFPIVLGGTHCYAILALGDESITQLDVMLMDASGAIAMRDVDEGPMASLGIAEQICPMDPAAFKVRVRVFSGSGHFTARVYRYALI